MKPLSFFSFKTYLNSLNNNKKSDGSRRENKLTKKKIKTKLSRFFPAAEKEMKKKIGEEIICIVGVGWV
jgi:hypothetical protein